MSNSTRTDAVGLLHCVSLVAITCLTHKALCARTDAARSDQARSRVLGLLRKARAPWTRSLAMRAPAALVSLLALCAVAARACQLPHDWRPQTEACRAELAEIIVFARVLAVHEDAHGGAYNYLPWQHEAGLFFSAEIELQCDQAWGSMLEVPAGSRFNVTGLGYFPCYSYSVVENNNYYFFLRMDENYNIIPHGVNFQDPIFPDTPENHRMFASLFQFSNCTAGTQVHTYTPEWEAQEDSRLLCSTVQKALFEEEEKVKTLSQKVKVLEKANNHLRDKVKNLKRLLRLAKRETKDQTGLLKQLHEPEPELPHPQQDTTQVQKPVNKKKLKT